MHFLQDLSITSVREVDQIKKVQTFAKDIAGSGLSAKVSAGTHTNVQVFSNPNAGTTDRNALALAIIRLIVDIALEVSIRIDADPLRRCLNNDKNN